jgi:hypothetical protein
MKQKSLISVLNSPHIMMMMMMMMIIIIIIIIIIISIRDAILKTLRAYFNLSLLPENSSFQVTLGLPCALAGGNNGSFAMYSRCMVSRYCSAMKNNINQRAYMYNVSHPVGRRV